MKPNEIGIVKKSFFNKICTLHLPIVKEAMGGVFDAVKELTNSPKGL